MTPPTHTKPIFDPTHITKNIMKRPVRSLFTAAFVFAVTLFLRIILTDPIRYNTFNKSLVTFAAVDSGDASLRHNVEHLVGSDLNNVKINFQRSFRSIGRYRLDTGSGYDRSGSMELNLNKIQLVFKQNLRKWWRNRRFDPDVMSNTVNVLGFKRKCKTCAVVGNSGILLKTNLGEVIDNHEFVIRLNNARNGGYEQFVGSKTSLSFINSNILHLCSRRGGCFCHPYGEHVPIVMYMSQPIHFLDYVVCNSSHKAALMVTDPQLDVLCARIVKYYSVKRFVVETGKGLESWSLVHGGTEFHYSSGMQAVMLALGICEKVSIFGFGKANGAKHHYHTNQKSELSLHDYEAEYDLYEDLVKNPKAVPFVSDKFKFPPVVIHR